jgi:hypothetical protein
LRRSYSGVPKRKHEDQRYPAQDCHVIPPTEYSFLVHAFLSSSYLRFLPHHVNKLQVKNA